ncbi:MAG: hypothetical protein JJ896_16305 [Rhodothermales bacterium]|nr:hypothetical protein [Rhodothermales bacterium]MBO6781219.1 hypothetical protein [Rhodothermales bacterium]
MRALLIFLVAGLAVGCTSNTEGNLPEQGTIVEYKDAPDERYQVTWAGISDYDQGACEVNVPCVHLRHTGSAATRTEVAVTLAEYNQQFRELK